MNGRTAYADFKANICGISTAIRIFETETNCFIYINQSKTEVHLYNSNVKEYLERNCTNMAGKTFNVICNLSKHEALNEVNLLVASVLNGEEKS